MGQFDGRVVLVTGGNSGIGRAAAIAFAREGAAVAVLGRRADACDAVVREIGADGGHAIAVPADVTIEHEVAAAVERTVDELGGLDVAFNNAGTWTAAPFADVTAEAWRRELEVNLTSVFLSLRHELPVMKRRGGGVVVNNASVLGTVGVAGLAPYVAAKHGVVGLGRAVALEEAQSGVRINTIAPAGVDTPHFRATFGAAEASATAFAEAHPVGRLATPEEVASLVLYLASDGAAFFHGAALAMDGGWSAQ